MQHTRTRILARVSAVAACAALAGGTGALTAIPTASASTLAMQCNHHEINVVFPTPLTGPNQSLTGAEVDSTLSDCNPGGITLDPVFKGVKTGHFDNGRLTSGHTTTCLGPVVTLTSTGTGKWVFENAKGKEVVSGNFDFEVTIGPGGSGLLVAEGVFTSGPLQGYRGFHHPLVLLPNGTCQTGGITALKSQGTADFRSP